VAILGDMFELGEQSEQLHREVGRFAIDNGTDLLLIAGENSRAMYEEAGDANALYFENTDSLIEALKNGDLIRKDDVVLVKASHSMGFERVVEVIRGL
jgi:UDP-N-acetylmuramoyl-tripeptide--D-alanyl-D-alanine ligase